MLPEFVGPKEIFVSTGVSVAIMAFAPILMLIGVFIALTFHLFCSSAEPGMDSPPW